MAEQEPVFVTPESGSAVVASPASTPVSSSAQHGKLPGPIAILKQAWGIYIKRFWVLFGIILVPSVVVVACVLLVSGGAALAVTLGLKLTAVTSIALAIALVILGVLFYVAVIYISIWAQAALLFAVKGSEQRVGFRESFRQASHKIGSLFGSAILFGGIVGGAILLVVIGFGILFALGNIFLPSAAIYINFVLALFGGIAVVVTGLTFGVRYCLATYVVVGDDVTAMSSLKRSRDYVAGYWWPVFWRLVFFMCVVIVCTLAVFLLVVLLGLALKGAGNNVAAAISSVADVVFSGIVAPLYAIYAYQVYANLKAVKGESQVPGDKKASGWIFVAVVVGLIAITTVPVSLLALSSARVKIRDAKRFADAGLVQTALELYQSDKGSYPSDLSQLTPTYIEVVPTAPMPADGSCTAAENQYQYTLVDPTDYTFTFCTGDVYGSHAAGVQTMTEQGIGMVPSANTDSTSEDSQAGGAIPAQTLTYSTPNFYFQYPASWIVVAMGNPSANPTASGDIWNDAAAIVDVNPAVLGTHPANSPVGVWSFKTSTSPLAWCQAQTGDMANCALVDESGGSVVTATSLPGDFPQTEYAILGGQSTLEVFGLTDPTYQSEFESIVNSALPQ